jgi:hypothetical protein
LIAFLIANFLVPGGVGEGDVKNAAVVVGGAGRGVVDQGAEVGRQKLQFTLSSILSTF